MNEQKANREILKEKEIEKREEEAGIQEPEMISGRPNLQDDREWTERIMNNMYHAGWEKGIFDSDKEWKKKIVKKIKAIKEQRKAENKNNNYYLEFAECLLKELLGEKQ
jgi:hypothetical protein